MFRKTVSRLILALLTTCCTGRSVFADTPTLFGTVDSSPARSAMMVANNITLVTYVIFWDRLEPQQGQLNQAYIAKVTADLQTFRDAGMKISLDPGMQYPPQWVRQLPHAMYVNQFGDAFDPTGQPGSNGLNAVFNQHIRNAQASHLSHLFKHFGTDFFALRLGWGLFGELNYPHPDHQGKKNCYWAFDPIAQGKIDGLPPTLSPCPVPGWTPGQPSEHHRSARRFANWYLNALKDYHDWQITQARQHYTGHLAMMMGSWGLRDGELETLIQSDLADNGRTEIQRGFDFPRFIAGVTDPGYIVYGTWLDTPAQFCDDASTNPARWSPIHYLSHAAKTHPLKLRVWAENTGRGNLTDMQLSFARAKAFSVQAIIWAFEDDLFSGKHATFEQYQQLIHLHTMTRKK